MWKIRIPLKNISKIHKTKAAVVLFSVVTPAVKVFQRHDSQPNLIVDFIPRKESRLALALIKTFSSWSVIVE